MSHRKLEMGNAALKSQTKHITFFKQKFSGLSPMNKQSPFREMQQVQQKNYSSVEQINKPTPKSLKFKPKLQLSFDSSRSPNKSPNTSNYSSRQASQKKDTKPKIISVKRQEQKINFDSLKSQNIYGESQKQIQQLMRQQQKPEDLKLILGLKSLIKKEKQVILNDIEQVIKQTEKYQQKIALTKNESEELKKQYQTMTEAQLLSLYKYNDTIEKYNKILHLLKELSIDYDTILPELKNNQTEEFLNKVPQEENKDETILLQQFIIKQLVTQIEDQKQLNQQLITKIQK